MSSTPTKFAAPARATGFGGPRAPAVATHRQQQAQLFDRGSAGSATYSTAGGAQTLMQEQQPLEKETVTIAKSMLRTVYETSDMATEAQIELFRQGDQIDRAADNMRRVHESMDKSEEHIKGMKSFFGGFFSRFSSKKPAIKLETDIDFPVEWERKKKLKRKTLRIGMEEFSRIGKNGILRASVPYGTINGILVKGDGFLEISHGKLGREAFRGPQHRTVVALLVRKSSKPFPVVFENPSESFDPRQVSLPGFAPPGAFGRRTADDALLQTVDYENSEALEDQILDKVSQGLNDIKFQALTINSELDRQQVKLGQLEVAVDAGNSRLRQGIKDIRELKR